MATKAKKASKTPARHPKSLRGFFRSAKWWIQGTMKNERTGACCLLGALEEVYGTAGFGEKYKIARNALQLAIREESPGYYAFTGSIMAYNDAKGRTFADIKRIVAKARV